MKQDKLSRKQLRFIQEYILDSNGTQAAIRAGYSSNGAAVQACRMLANPNIQAQLQKELDDQARRVNVNADGVIAELAKIGFANVDDFFDKHTLEVDLSDVNRAQLAAVGEITVSEYTEGKGEDRKTVRQIKVKMHDKLKALEALGRHFGIFADEKNNNDEYRTISSLSDAELADRKRRLVDRVRAIESGRRRIAEIMPPGPIKLVQ